MIRHMLKIIAVLCFFVSFCYMAINITDKESYSHYSITNNVQTKRIKELEEKYPLKPVHANLVFECVFCHEGQGNHAKEFSAPDEEMCLSCHKSKEFLASRLSYMDTLQTNPHNSIHDGLTLSCDECHNEHKASYNICSDCHEDEIENNLWMRKIP